MGVLDTFEHVTGQRQGSPVISHKPFLALDTFSMPRDRLAHTLTMAYLQVLSTHGITGHCNGECYPSSRMMSAPYDGQPIVS